jgi:hypothetical protein
VEHKHKAHGTINSCAPLDSPNRTLILNCDDWLVTSTCFLLLEQQWMLPMVGAVATSDYCARAHVTKLSRFGPDTPPFAKAGPKFRSRRPQRPHCCLRTEMPPRLGLVRAAAALRRITSLGGWSLTRSPHNVNGSSHRIRVCTPDLWRVTCDLTL